MQLRGLLVTLVVLFALVFAAANWEILNAPARVNLFVGESTLPLGLVLLTATVLLGFLFLLLALFERAARLGEHTQTDKKLEALQAKLAEKRSAEFAALETFIHERLRGLEERFLESQERFDRALEAQREHLEEHEALLVKRVEERVTRLRHELATDIAQLEERQKGLLHGAPAGD